MQRAMEKSELRSNTGLHICRGPATATIADVVIVDHHAKRAWWSRELMQSDRFIHGGGKYRCKSGIVVTEYPLSHAGEQNP
jgi:hypothetical protein